MDDQTISTIKAKADLIEAAKVFDVEQAKRAAEFQAQVDKHFGRTPRKLDPIDAAYLRQKLAPWFGSTCLPGRILPHLLFGSDYANHPSYVPIERRYVLTHPPINLPARKESK